MNNKANFGLSFYFLFKTFDNVTQRLMFLWLSVELPKKR